MGPWWLFRWLLWDHGDCSDGCYGTMASVQMVVMGPWWVFRWLLWNHGECSVGYYWTMRLVQTVVTRDHGVCSDSCYWTMVLVQSFIMDQGACIDFRLSLSLDHCYCSMFSLFFYWTLVHVKLVFIDDTPLSWSNDDILWFRHPVMVPWYYGSNNIILL